MPLKTLPKGEKEDRCTSFWCLGRSQNDQKSVKCLKKIYFDEINHVKIGEYWFRWICKKNQKNPERTWHKIINNFFNKKIQIPVYSQGREKANMSTYLSYNP